MAISRLVLLFVAAAGLLGRGPASTAPQSWPELFSIGRSTGYRALERAATRPTPTPVEP